MIKKNCLDKRKIWREIMYIEKSKIELKDKSMCILRNPQRKDASKIIQFLMETAKESDFLLRMPEEVNTSLEYEVKRIEWMNESPEELVLLAEKDDKIIGILMTGKIGRREKVKHRCSLTVAVSGSYRRVGIGNLLLQYALKYMKNSGFQIAELEVVSRNCPAINLYLKNEFRIIGERPYAVLRKDGTYDNCLIMYKRL
ncbi:GNAT family N-acetyltransferase [Lachnospiraceae bacterium 50-23]